MAKPEDRRPPGPTAARKLAIFGALTTGAAGIVMAIFSVYSGEETGGGGALLAASALAFGLLALNLDWIPRRSVYVSEEPQAAAPNGRSPASEGPSTRASSQIDAEPITGRELEVLTLVAEGYSNKLISSTLGISERTVKSHLTATMGKLRASDRTHAVVTAIRLGWLDVSRVPPTPTASSLRSGREAPGGCDSS